MQIEIKVGERKCKHCGIDKAKEASRHAHCSDCGCLIRRGRTQHKANCERLSLPQHAFCPKCFRLLAAGAWCPKHGNPVVGA